MHKGASGRASFLCNMWLLHRSRQHCKQTFLVWPYCSRDHQQLPCCNTRFSRSNIFQAILLGKYFWNGQPIFCRHCSNKLQKNVDRLDVPIVIISHIALYSPFFFAHLFYVPMFHYLCIVFQVPRPRTRRCPPTSSTMISACRSRAATPTDLTTSLYFIGCGCLIVSAFLYPHRLQLKLGKCAQIMTLCTFKHGTIQKDFFFYIILIN